MEAMLLPFRIGQYEPLHTASPPPGSLDLHFRFGTWTEEPRWFLAIFGTIAPNQGIVTCILTTEAKNLDR